MTHRSVVILLVLITAAILVVPAPAQQKPFTQEQVQAMVRDGLGDETGADAIQKRGIDFAPTEALLESLKLAGASEVFLAAVRTAKRPETMRGTPKKPLTQVQVFALLIGQVPSHRVTILVRERGVDFEPTDDYLQEVRLAGGEDELVSALQIAKVTKPEPAEAPVQAQQLEIRRHAEHCAEYFQQKRYGDAEVECSAALKLDPQNVYLATGLAEVWSYEQKWDNAAEAARDAIRLDPSHGDAHTALGFALYHLKEADRAIAEFHEALGLDPDDDSAHVGLGGALYDSKDYIGAEAEFRRALELNPKNDQAHAGLGGVLAVKGDDNGGIAEVREAVRLNPDNGVEHALLGYLLEQTGDAQGAKEEYRVACTLNPSPHIPNCKPGGTESRPTKIESPSGNPPDQELPESELAGIQGTCEFPCTALHPCYPATTQSGLLFYHELSTCTLYNGSNWDVSSVTVLVIVKERDKKKGISVVLSRRYELEGGPYVTRPAHSGMFRADLELSIEKHQWYEWNLVSAKGHPASGR